MRAERRGARAHPLGYALLVVMATAALLLISLTAALPSIYQDAQREREEELIFRGIEYARAIALFHRQFQRFPTDVKELLQTNGIRFLRQAYPDPMDGKGKWRFIHANAAGAVLDSKLQGSPMNGPNGPGMAFGNSQSAFGSNDSQPNSQSQSSFSSSFSVSPQGNSQPSSFGSGSQQGSPPTSAFFGSDNQMVGGFIVGVAATSHKESIRTWNNRTHYDEWEFIGVDLNLLGISAGPVLGGTTGQSQGQSGLGGQSSGPSGIPYPASPPGFGTPSPPPPPQ